MVVETWTGEFGSHSSFFYGSELRPAPLDSYVNETSRMCRGAILVEYKIVWQQVSTVLDELSKEIIHVEI